MSRSGSRKATTPSEQNARKPWTQLVQKLSPGLWTRGPSSVSFCVLQHRSQRNGQFSHAPVGWTLRWEVERQRFS
ncbi:hypothetical protein RRG08_057417, partial [Elysia crispata]